MILVVCALPAELRFFTPSAGVKVFACGVGPVEAAIGVARELAAGSYTAVINAGIGGIYRDVGRVGDARLIVADALADFGLEGGGALALPEGTLVERASANPALIEVLAEIAPHTTGLTVAAVTTTDATGTRLRARYGHDVETMEGMAVFRAAQVASVPAIGVRGISNFIGDRARSDWDFAAGARATAAALDRVFARLATRKDH